MSSPAAGELGACPECDQLHRRRPLPEGGSARCSRCNALLYRHRHNSLERSLSLYLTALVLLILTNIFPFMGFSLSGQLRETLLFSGIFELFQEGYWPLALLVLMTIIVIPAVQICGYIWLLWPLHHGRRSFGAARLFRWLRAMRPWAMIEVYVLGVLVSLVKLANYASVVPGIALFSLGLLMLTLAAAASSLDPDDIWRQLDPVT